MKFECEYLFIDAFLSDKNIPPMEDSNDENSFPKLEKLFDFA
jgi:hypothetical protein